MKLHSAHGQNLRRSVFFPLENEKSSTNRFEKKEKNRFNDCIVVFKLVEVAEVAEEVEVLQ